MVQKDVNPLVEVVPPEVPLVNAPLIRVVAQVKFPLIVSIEKKEFIAPFQEAIRDDYPILRLEKTREFTIGAQTLESTPPNVAWRFGDAKGVWRASVSSGFVALETTTYTSRSDFIKRFKILLEAVNKHIEPKLVDRIGIRYIDQVKGESFNKISKLVRKEVLGILGTPAIDYTQHALSETLFDLPDSKAKMLTRWGRLPAQATPDPDAIEPVSGPSWILDIDVFCNEHKPFIPSKLTAEADKYSKRIYSFFRWAVTDAFLQEYGGKI
jgi:uncharacterized protein (TIGR04255 family)